MNINKQRFAIVVRHDAVSHWDRTQRAVHTQNGDVRQMMFIKH